MLDALKPYSKENGGPLTVEHVWYHEGRGNVIIGYTPDGAEGTVAFIGSHLDVVPANPETWERNPFKLVVEVKHLSFFISFSTAFFKSPQGDKLYGRGTTDCLGHVALLTQLFIELAIKKPTLKREVWAVLIAWYVNTAAASHCMDDHSPSCVVRRTPPFLVLGWISC